MNGITPPSVLLGGPSNLFDRQQYLGRGFFYPFKHRPHNTELTNIRIPGPKTTAHIRFPFKHVLGSADPCPMLCCSYRHAMEGEEATRPVCGRQPNRTPTSTATVRYDEHVRATDAASHYRSSLRVAGARAAATAAYRYHMACRKS